MEMIKLDLNRKLSDKTTFPGLKGSRLPSGLSSRDNLGTTSEQEFADWE